MALASPGIGNIKRIVSKNTSPFCVLQLSASHKRLEFDMEVTLLVLIKIAIIFGDLWIHFFFLLPTNTLSSKIMGWRDNERREK